MERQLPMGLRFSLLHRAFLRRLDAHLQEKGLTGVQFGVLGQLERLRCEGSVEVNQRDLERATRVTHPTMTEILKRLEKQGFVRCTPSERDRRFKCVCPTEKATALRREMDELDSEIFYELSRGLADEDRAKLAAMTEIMLQNAFSGCKNREGEDRSSD